MTSVGNGTMVDHSPQHLKVKCSSPSAAPGTGRENISQGFEKLQLKVNQQHWKSGIVFEYSLLLLALRVTRRFEKKLPNFSKSCQAEKRPKYLQQSAL